MIKIEQTYRNIDGKEIEESCLISEDANGGELIEILTPDLAWNLIEMLSGWLRSNALGEDPCCCACQRDRDNCECGEEK